MSNPSEPSIPHSPTPGKDPPHSPPPSNLPSTHLPSSHLSKHHEISTSASSKTKQTLPAITTQPPSRSTTFHPQHTLPSHSSFLSQHPHYPQTQIHSQNTITALQNEETTARPSSFAPFFTLVTDIKDTEHETQTYHPRNIHYIFSDDDENTDVLSSALLRTLSGPSSHFSQEIEPEAPANDNNNNTATSSSSSSSPTKKKGHRVSKPPSLEKDKDKEKGREERILIVDINTLPTGGLGIKKISSLNKDWQVLNASIDNAPTWDGAISSSGDEDGGVGGLMLKIEGVGISGDGLSSSSGNLEKGKGKEKEGGGSGGSSILPDQEMHSLLESFDRKMEVLRRVVGQHREFGGLEDGLGLGMDTGETIGGEEKEGVGEDGS